MGAGAADSLAMAFSLSRPWWFRVAASIPIANPTRDLPASLSARGRTIRASAIAGVRNSGSAIAVSTVRAARGTRRVRPITSRAASSAGP